METISEREHRVRFQPTDTPSAPESQRGLGQGLPSLFYPPAPSTSRSSRGSTRQNPGRGDPPISRSNSGGRGSLSQPYSTGGSRGGPGGQHTPLLHQVTPETASRDFSSSEFCPTDWENWFLAVDQAEPQPAVLPTSPEIQDLYTYYRLYIRSGLSVAGFSPKFSDVLINLKKADPMLILMVWNAQDMNPGLTSITSIPTDTITVNKYYSRRTADPNQFQGCIRIKTCFDSDTLISKMQSWVKTGGHILTCMQCQAEVTAKMGALFRTTQSIHRGHLFTAIKDTAQYKRDGQGFQFGLLSSEFQAGGE